MGLTRAERQRILRRLTSGSSAAATSSVTTPPRLQYTSVRTRVVNGPLLIGLKHTIKDPLGDQHEMPWLEMPPDEVARLIKTLQQALDGAIPPREAG